MHLDLNLVVEQGLDHSGAYAILQVRGYNEDHAVHLHDSDSLEVGQVPPWYVDEEVEHDAHGR